MSADRLSARFAACAAQGRAALVTFVTAGDPDLAVSAEILAALPGAGADVIELGMPFTDPMADGPAIQRGNLRSLGAGTTLTKDAPAGDYQSRVRLQASGQTLASVPVRIHVWDFTLPDENHVAAIYDVRFGPDRGVWGKPLDAVYPEIIRFLASRRLCPDTIRPAPVFRRENGKIAADFTDFDRAAEVYFDELKFPFAYTPWDLYLFGWGHPPKTIFGERPYEGEPPFASADRSRLRPGNRLDGPALVLQFDATTVLPPGWTATIDGFGNLHLLRNKPRSLPEMALP